MNTRVISHSELSTLLTCQYKWDFSYGDQLVGSALKSKDTALILRDGRAWGAGVAAFDAGDPIVEVHHAIARSLDEDAERLREFGLFQPEEFAEQVNLLVDLMDHHISTNLPLGLERLELEVEVPIPSRTGRQDSNRYRYQAFFDGIHVDEMGRTWLVEYKLRTQLSSLPMLYLSRQLRFYAWAYRKEFGVEVAGIMVRERFKSVPQPARLVKGKKKSDPDFVPSHAKDQKTTPELYQALCDEHKVKANPETIDVLASRRWQLHEPIFLTSAEIDEAGRQLTSAGAQIHDFDVANRYPVRNPNQMFCGGCQFKEICPNPADSDLVDALFERTVPKKDKPPKREEVTA